MLPQVTVDAILPGRGASDYERYLRTDELLALQKAPEEMNHRDELFFRELAAKQLGVVHLYLRGRDHEALYQLAEALIELDERLIVWCVRHFKAVQRTIGGAVLGTQGTPVEVLGRLVHDRWFPQLWDARNELTRIAGTS
jgi:tryptophan 2,3-dioxygenase